MSTSTTFSVCLVVALAALAAPDAVLAQQPAGTCTISSTGVNFGAYDVFNASHSDVVGTITYNCTRRRDIRIYLNKGVFAPTFDPRRMAGAGEFLNYNLYTTATRSPTVIWGDGTGGTVFYALNNAPRNDDVVVTIYGRVPAMQDVAAGGYADTVVATILW